MSAAASEPVTALVDERPRLYRILDYNSKFVESKGYTHLKRPVDKAARKSVIVTCMDTRLIRLLPHALNVHEGDAKLIKNAGAVITHPFGGIMRSVIVALYELNADEVYVIGHHDCGMSKINPAHTLERMVHAGIKPETITTLEYAGINIQRWLHGFDSVLESVVTSVKIIRNHPLVPSHVPVHGLIIDPETGKLDLLVDGHAELAARAGLSLPIPIPGTTPRSLDASAVAAAFAAGVGVAADGTAVGGAACPCCTPAASGLTGEGVASADRSASSCADCAECRAAVLAAQAAAAGSATHSSGSVAVLPVSPGGPISSLSPAERGISGSFGGNTGTATGGSPAHDDAATASGPSSSASSPASTSPCPPARASASSTTSPGSTKDSRGTFESARSVASSGAMGGPIGGERVPVTVPPQPASGNVSGSRPGSASGKKDDTLAGDAIFYSLYASS